MSRTRRARASSGGPELTDLQWDYLLDVIQPNDPRRVRGRDKWPLYELDANKTLGALEPITEQLWAAYGADVLDYWTRAFPGTRPSCFWRFFPDAPRHEGDREGHAPEDQQTWLAERDLLTAGERRALRKVVPIRSELEGDDD